jgi:hypothetical protein
MIKDKRESKQSNQRRKTFLYGKVILKLFQFKKKFMIDQKQHRNPRICQSSLWIWDVWQSLHSREVALAGPLNEDMNVGYCDLMLCTFCTLIGTLLCIVASSFCHCFVISFRMFRRLWINKWIINNIEKGNIRSEREQFLLSYC